MSVLAVERLSKSFGGVHALREVSFSVARGEMLAMIGPNGAGKSTCFNLINGQLRRDAGSILLEGRPIEGLAPRELCLRGVGRTFQVAATFGSMTVRENLQVALLARAQRLRSLASAMDAGSARDAEGLLEKVGMREQADRPCAELAYGDLKRVELAVALAAAPRLLLMDEPTAGMAPAERGALMQLVAGIARTGGIAVLFTEHDMDVVFGHANRIIVLADGELIAQGAPAAVRADPRVRRVYLGEGGGDA
jgi:branched-chain amino acid transport system ATP-binding protein